MTSADRTPPPPGWPPVGYPTQPVVINVVQNSYIRPVVYRRRVNHWAHFWMTVFTGGLWIPVWIHASRRR